jgi:hypothetical protein
MSLLLVYIRLVHTYGTNILKTNEMKFNTGHVHEIMPKLVDLG